MQRRTRVSVLGILAAGVLVGLAGPAAVAPTAAPPAYAPGAASVTAVNAALQTAPAGEAEAGPTALTRHLEELRQATPGGQGALEGPGSAEEQAFAIRAYPADSITRAQAQRAEASFQSARNRAASFSTAAADAAWQPYGPSRALYPFTQFRNYSNYVPNKYVAGGRTTSLTLAPTCVPGDCRLWITPAGGGIWRTDDATVDDPTWKYLGGPLAINSAGAISLDPNDRTGGTLYLGTGEANTCASGCVAGAGLYRSTDGGDTWRGPLGRRALGGKGIGQIIVRPGDASTIYAATTTALRGMSSPCCDGVTRPVPDAKKWGLYKSTDRGRTWRFIHNGSADPASCTGSQTEFANSSDCSPRGVRHLALDPSDADTLYASSYARGVWRSTDAGRTWTQIKPSINPALTTSRAAIAVTELADGRTRMYVHEGNAGTPYSRLFRSDDVATGTPAFADLTSEDPADPGFATFNQCGAQCWYDLFVYTPKGNPDVVYTGGSYGYGETAGISNGRAVVLSTDAGRTGTDMTMDATDDIHPNALHPDQHALVTLPGKPFTFIEANDGGVMRSSGRFASMSQDCAKRGLVDPTTGDETALRRCQQLLSRIPTKLEDLNEGLNTLQFTNIEVSPHDEDTLIGGTQDNGTWQTAGNRTTWRNKMIGDGGFAGFDAEKPAFRFHTFTGASVDVNFDGGDIGKWIWTADPIAVDPGDAVLHARHRRPAGQRHDVRRQRADRAPHQDLRPRHADDRGGQPHLQRVDRHLRGDVRRLGAPRGHRPDRCGLGQPQRRRRLGAGAPEGQPQHAVGRHRHRPAVRVPQRPGRPGLGRALHPGRPAQHAGPLHLGHHRRRQGRQPRVGVLQRLRLDDARHDRPRLRGPLRPGHRHGAVDRPLERPGRPADHGRRP